MDAELTERAGDRIIAFRVTVFCGSRLDTRLFAPARFKAAALVEDTLTQTDRLRRDLDQFVVFDELDRAFERHVLLMIRRAIKPAQPAPAPQPAPSKAIVGELRIERPEPVAR
jgi:hypothetical protein